MKAKTQSSPTALGACIRLERLKAGLTQAELGKRIGLGESRVSKIENGAPITPEVASYILGKLGSELQLKIVNKGNDTKSIPFITTVILNYAKAKNLTLGQAYRYLKTFKGLDYINRYMDIERTLAYEDIVGNLSKICANNGGRL